VHSRDNWSSETRGRAAVAEDLYSEDRRERRINKEGRGKETPRVLLQEETQKEQI